MTVSRFVKLYPVHNVYACAYRFELVVRVVTIIELALVRIFQVICYIVIHHENNIIFRNIMLFQYLRSHKNEYVIMRIRFR